MKKFVVPLMCLLIVATTVSAQALVKYHVTPISDLGLNYPPSSGPIGFTFSINDAGQVAGYTNVNYNPLPFIWQSGTSTPISVIPGTLSSQALDINNAGQVLLKGYLSGYVYVGSVYTLANETHTLLGDLAGGTIYTVPTAMNDVVPTQVIGQSNSTLGYEGFLWQNDTMTGLGQTNFFLRDINNTGTIVGDGSSSPLVRTAAGTITSLATPAGYRYCQAWAINNTTGMVVGHCQSSTNYTYAAVLWIGQIPQLLPMPPGATSTWACDINDSGLVAGQAVYTAWDDSRGIKWKIDPNPVTVTDLNTVLESTGMDATIMHVRSINNSGLMVGYGKEPGAVNIQTYLLTPYSTTAHVATTPTSLSFSAASGIDPASQTLLITNTLGSAMNWTIDSSTPWLTVASTSGSGNSAEVSVSASVAGLVAGTYVGNLTISSDQADNTPLTVPVTLIVDAGIPPHIVVSPASLSYSIFSGTGNPAPQSLALSNSGAGILSWTLATNQAWLTATPVTGTGPGTASIVVNTNGLVAGTYSGSITITDPSADNNPLTVPVILTILPRPSINFSPSSFSFSAEEGGANPPPQTITISNSYLGTLNWTLSDNVSWLSENPVSGVNTGTSTLSVNIAGLTAGTYLGTITITDPNASNSPRSVGVALTIRKKPRIAFSPAGFSFSAEEGTSPASQALSISNSGGGTLSWTLSSSPDWLTVTPAAGTGAGTATIMVNTTGLLAGTYFGTITITAAGADNSPQSIPVTLTIVARPSIAFSPAGFTFTAPQGGANPLPQTLSISNSGGGSLTWSLSVNQTWLSVAPSSGTNAGTSTLSVNSYYLAVGTYTAAVSITDPAAGNSPQIVPVTLTITAGGPYLRAGLGAAELTAFTGVSNTKGLQIDVWNAGTGTLNWTASTSATWLTVKPTKGSSTGPARPSMLTVTMTWTKAGIYTGNVIIKNGAKATDILVIPITLDVRNPNTVTAPNGGEYLKYASSFTITWLTDDLIAPMTSSAKIYYSTNGGTSWISVAALPDNPGSYQWLVPSLLKASAKCKVKVVLIGQDGSPIGEDSSNAVFTIGK